MPDSEIQQHDDVQLAKTPFTSVEAPPGRPYKEREREPQGEREGSLLWRALTFFLVGIVCSLLLLGLSLYRG